MEANLEQSIESLGKEEPFKKESSELGQAFGNLDSDETDAETNMSKIDFNARLNSFEVTSCIIVDELIQLGILPKDVRITRQKKRLSVSLGGEGRKEKVAIASSSRERSNPNGKKGIISRIFTRRGEGD